jgi:hypothetical protein
MATFLLRCNALALFSFVLCDILTEERLSPVPAEAGYRQRLDDQACIYFVLIHSIDRNLQARGFVENTQSPDFMITTNREGSRKLEEKCARFPRVSACCAVSFDTSQPTGALYSYCNF